MTMKKEKLKLKKGENQIAIRSEKELTAVLGKMKELGVVWSYGQQADEYYPDTEPPITLDFICGDLIWDAGLNPGAKLDGYQWLSRFNEDTPTQTIERAKDHEHTGTEIVLDGKKYKAIPAEVYDLIKNLF